MDRARRQRIVPNNGEHRAVGPAAVDAETDAPRVVAGTERAAWHEPCYGACDGVDKIWRSVAAVIDRNLNLKVGHVKQPVAIKRLR